MEFNQSYFDQCVPLIVNLGFREARLEALANYLRALCIANNELNLMSRQTGFKELMDNHVIDCLLPLRFFPQTVKKAADFGSGGGLPGVLYAIHFSDVEYTLYEKSPKKREFLNKCIKFAPNLKISGEIPKNFDGVDVVTARAFKPADVIVDMSAHYFKMGGSYFLLKGRLDKIEEENKDLLKKFKDAKVEITKLESPLLDVERHLVRISKK